jgi:putative ABC transport system permease protein
MNWWQRLVHGRRVERQLDAELRFHFERLIADNLAKGMTTDEARREARLAFGGIVSASVATRRFQAALILLFAALSLVLAAIGVSGVMTYAVARQTDEIGVRVALGAQRSTVLRTVLLQELRPVAAGLAVGFVAAAAAARSIQSFLFGIEPFDPIALGAAAGLLLLAASLACDLPARRAAKMDPLIALRFE